MNTTKTAPAPAAQKKPSKEIPPEEITISQWKPYENGACRGFFDMILPSGMILSDWVLYENDKGRWIKSPSRQLKGSELFKPYVGFVNNAEIRNRFSNDVLAALERYAEATGKRL